MSAEQNHMEFLAGLTPSRHAMNWRGGHDYSPMWQERPEGLTQIERLDEPKYSLSDDLEALQQTLASAWSVYLRRDVTVVERR